jgi:hypothetical protein
LQPHYKTFREVKTLAYALACEPENQKMIQKEKDDEARISCIMKIFRFDRCTNEMCKKIYTSGKIECGEGVGQAKKQDRLCESCAGFECRTHKDPEKMVKKCEFCCD